MADVAPLARTNRPKNTPMRWDLHRQHRMAGVTCAPSSPVLSVIYCVVGAAFIAYGVVIVLETDKVTEVETRYDYIDACRAHWWGGSHCTIDLNITSEMHQPVFLYYSIKYMYLNNRYFSKSKDVLQLMGNDRTKDDVQKSCFPIVTMKELGRNESLPLDSSDVANPCGLLPRAMFNDSFALSHLDTNTEIRIEETEIAWSSDLRQKYERVHDWTSKQWIDVENGAVYCRALHGVDGRFRSSPLPQTLGTDRAVPSSRSLPVGDRQQ